MPEKPFKQSLKMNPEFFRNLPSEIIIDILSRLPVRTIISCKCVCKSWLDLLETDEFVKSHLSKSVPGLVVYHFEMQHPALYKVYEFEDGLDLEHHELHYNLVTKFDFAHAALINGSVNGLLLLPDISPNALYICNPITRDYIEFHSPQAFVCSHPQCVCYGFGASKMTGQHKVVGIFYDCKRNQEADNLLPKSECQIYTLGTGSWRSMGPGPPLEYDWSSFGLFLNGNLHWLVFDLRGFPWISCFDLESEIFSTFSPPPLPRPPPPLPGLGRLVVDLFALGDCLCLCDNTSDDEIVIWLMKEDGVEKSWTKEFVISKIPDFAAELNEVVRPIKVFRDGDVLMAWQNFFLFYYSSKTKTTQKIDMFELFVPGRMGSILHTPSFLSLRSFGMENDLYELFCEWFASIAPYR